MKAKISEFEKNQEWAEHLITEVLRNASGETGSVVCSTCFVAGS